MNKYVPAFPKNYLTYQEKINEEKTNYQNFILSFSKNAFMNKTKEETKKILDLKIWFKKLMKK